MGARLKPYSNEDYLLFLQARCREEPVYDGRHREGMRGHSIHSLQVDGGLSEAGSNGAEVHPEAGEEVPQCLRAEKGALCLAMYADIDNRGRVSLFELDTNDTEAILEALKQYRETLQVFIDLIEGNEHTHRQISSTDKAIRELQHIIRLRDE